MVREDFNTAMTNRSLRTIKAELEFLTDANLLTHEQLASILSQLPAQPGATATTVPTTAFSRLSTNNNNNNNSSSNNGYSSNNEKSTYTTPATTTNTQGPPPAYPTAPAPPPSAGPVNALTYATALYAYAPTDAGDLALQPHDRVAVTEYMNAEWWKGRSERTGQEGIFPRNYVKAEGLDVKGCAGAVAPKAGSGYGNLPLQVSQGGGGNYGGGGGGGPVQRTESAGQSRMSTPGGEAGKKFGKKLGNAAVFGAGATIGGKIVNGIF